MILPEDNPFVDEALGGEPQPFSFATVAGVYADGLSLQFPNEAASAKHYLCNQYCKFAVGQHVFVVKVSGTYVALCPIGAPAANIVADTATKADLATAVASNDDGSRILLSANLTTRNYNMWNQLAGWKRINNV